VLFRHHVLNAEAVHKNVIRRVNESFTHEFIMGTEPHTAGHHARTTIRQHASKIICLAMAKRAEKQSKSSETDPPVPPANWDRCHVYLQRKGRFCKQFPYPGSTHCGNHIHLLDHHVDAVRKRIPCPVDPSHIIFQDQVEKHKLICPKVKKQREQQEKPYFRRSINLGGHGSLGGSRTREQTVQWAQQLALKVLQLHQTIYTGTSPDNVRLLTQEDIYNAIPMKDLSQPEMEAGLPEAVEAYRIKSGGHRHLLQQASLVGHLRRIGVLPALNTSTDGDTIFLEMGAGRGMLGLVAAGVASASNSSKVCLALVERAGSRSKADNVLRTDRAQSDHDQKYMKLKTLEWTRIQCDLAHIHMPTVIHQYTQSHSLHVAGEKRKEPPARPKVVVIAKHLCGAGTDLALKSLRDVSHEVDACVMATCCHGVCSWSEYVGRDYLCEAFRKHDLDFGEHEFELLRRWSTGTICSMAKEGVSEDRETAELAPSEDATEEHTTCWEDVSKDVFTLSAIVDQIGLICDVQGVGRACQRLLDYGRCKYMENELNFGGTGDQSSATCNVELCHYVPASITPQNAILVSYKTLAVECSDSFVQN
jgi:tRNA:m4X modification enzyme